MRLRAALLASLCGLGSASCRPADEDSKVARSAAAVAVDPLIGPFNFVDAPVRGTAVGDQTRPSIAFSGSIYLAAWNDGGLGRGVRRISASGTLLDPNGIAVGPLGAPIVMWTGAEFLIVYQGNNQILGRRVREDGTVVDAAPIVIAGPTNTGIYNGVGAANHGASAFVVWSIKSGASGSGFDLYGARLDGTTVLDAAPGRPIVTLDRDQADPWVSYGGGKWLVTWGEPQAGKYNGNGVRVDAATNLVQDTTPLSLVTGLGGPAKPVSVTDGTDFFVTFDGAPAPVLVASATGAISPITVGATKPSAAYVDGAYQLVSQGQGGFWGNRVTPAGAVLDGTVGAPIASCRFGGNVGSTWIFAGGGSNAYVAWTLTGNHGSDLYGSRWSAAGGLADAPGVLFQTSANSQRLYDLAGGGANGWFAVWRDDRDLLGSTTMGARLDPQGRTLDPTAMVLRPVDVGNAVVSYDGSRYLVLWMENGHLVGRRIEAATGAMVDAGEPLGLYSVNGLNRPVGLGSNGDGWLVAWQDSGQAKVRAGRISAAGAGLDGTTGFALPATTTANRPLVAFGGGAYLVVWGDGDPASPSPMLRGERVDGTTGALMDATAIAIGSTGPPAAPGYAVGFGQSSFVVTDNGTARRISPSTGAVSAPFAVSSSGPGETDLSFDGSAFLQTYPRLDGSGYSATRFREDGTDLDPADLALSVSADGTAYDGVPTAGIPGRFLVGLDRMIASPEIGSVRAVTAVIQSCGDGGCSPADGGASDLPIVPGAPANLPPGCATDGPSDAGAEAAPADATSMDSSAPGDAAAADSGASDATGDGAADATGASDGPAPPSDGAGSGSTADGRDGPASDGRDGRAADAGPGGGGCGCEASGPASAPSWIALAVGLAFLHARRSRRR